jgi:hypothetical protein
MASLFVIREKSTGTFCTGQKFRHFVTDLQSAAMFASKKNAEKAIRGMFAGGSSVWVVEDQRYIASDLEEYVAGFEFTSNCDPAFAKLVRETYIERKCEMEAVEVKLMLV